MDPLSFPVDFTAELFRELCEAREALQRHVSAHGAMDNDERLLTSSHELIDRVRSCG